MRKCRVHLEIVVDVDDILDETNATTEEKEAFETMTTEQKEAFIRSGFEEAAKEFREETPGNDVRMTFFQMEEDKEEVINL